MKTKKNEIDWWGADTVKVLKSLFKGTYLAREVESVTTSVSGTNVFVLMNAKEWFPGREDKPQLSFDPKFWAGIADRAGADFNLCEVVNYGKGPQLQFLFQKKERRE